MRLPLFVILAAAAVAPTYSQIISEIAGKGSTGTCTGHDWVEIQNPSSSSSLDISNFILHDDNGASDSNAYVFPASTVLAPSGYLVICCNQVDSSTGAIFKVGGGDQISIADASKQLIDTSGVLPSGAALDITYARDPADGDKFKYTTSPTPSAENVYVPYDKAFHLAKLSAQNALGIDFFGMDVNGTKPSSAMPDVVDLEITMSAENEAKMWDEQSYEMYHDVESFKVASEVLPMGGRMRPRGQSTLAIATCVGFKQIPFLLDFTSNDNAQRLFGVEKMFLRHHMDDSSAAREWSMHRMLARSGLAYLRTRTIRLLINGDEIGIYEAMEAPGQEYVFARSFPTYNMEDYALFKWKTLAAFCGNPDFGFASSSALEAANDVPPYAFERGSHRDKIPALPESEHMNCGSIFLGNIMKEVEALLSAYKAYSGDCADVLVWEGLLDQDLGTSNWKEIMKSFYRDIGEGCPDSACTGSKVPDQVDVDNWLKNFAWYAITEGQDSPMGNRNNWYLANANDGTGWKIVQYDHNGILTGAQNDFLCHEGCSDRLVDWSINRPTCTSIASNPVVGPLLSNPTYHAQYLDHVKDHLDNVLTDDFFSEISEHILALKPYKSGLWASGWNVDLDNEANADFSQAFWGDSSPFLALLKLRRGEIYKQIEALNDGSFKRPTEDLFDEMEICVDWETSSIGATKDASPCPPECAQAEPCYGFAGCQYRRSDGLWDNPLQFCNPAFPACDVCYPDTECPFGDGTDEDPVVAPDKADYNGIVISEISSKPVDGICGGNDYIELYNPTDFKIIMSNYILHDDRGHNDVEAFHLPTSANINKREVLLLCANGNGISSPAFGISDEDAISISTSDGTPVTSAGRMSGVGLEEGQSWTLQEDGTYKYEVPTPFVFENFGEAPRGSTGYLDGSGGNGYLDGSGAAMWGGISLFSALVTVGAAVVTLAAAVWDW
eukprot:CAMPEP_0118634400 /NCGR_PEP_ID=MMETSP0785-20121206/1521_1 /TAXON_ID=91992 /ORGANISM="Bolidomonas pacifica, Strain CCMP 1866" /LENGTH=951 /DNA_ID=CAMNT_0006525361 /DNA_START=344 /DNA_END=3199 /DNA_ORIENTATION=-